LEGLKLSGNTNFSSRLTSNRGESLDSTRNRKNLKYFIGLKKNVIGNSEFNSQITTPLG